jgi:hypothetical protein
LHLTCNWKQDETMDATKTKPYQHVCLMGAV